MAREKIKIDNSTRVFPMPMVVVGAVVEGKTTNSITLLSTCLLKGLYNARDEAAGPTEKSPPPTLLKLAKPFSIMYPKIR